MEPEEPRVEPEKPQAAPPREGTRARFLEGMRMLRNAGQHMNACAVRAPAA